jgi:hypothetical protein
MATEQMRCAMRLVPGVEPVPDAQEVGERLVISGRLSCFSYTSRDHVSNEQETVSIELGRFVATLFLAAVKSARIYRYDNSVRNKQCAGAIAKVEFVAYDPAGKQLLTDTFIPGLEKSAEDFVSHNEIWRTANGFGNQPLLQRFVSDQFVELIDEESDEPVWEGKSISICRNSRRDIARPQNDYAVQEFLPRRQSQDFSEGYFSYTHDFNGKIKEFHWVLMGLITDITPMLISVAG